METELGVKNALDHFREMLGVMAVQRILKPGIHCAVTPQGNLAVHLQSDLVGPLDADKQPGQARRTRVSPVGMPRIRKLTPRSVPGGDWLSGEKLWRSVQLRFLAGGIFFAGCLLMLLHGKMSRMFGPSPVVMVDIVVGAALLGVVVRGMMARRGSQIEPTDMEREMVAVDVDAELSVGRLSPRDLVFEHGRWTTLLESVQFGEVAEVPYRAAVARRRVGLGVLVIG